MACNSRRRIRSPRVLYLWLGYWAVLFVVMHRPLPPIRNLRPGSDKVAHYIVYFVLVILGGWYVRSRGRRRNRAGLVGWAVVYMAYAGFDEWLQQFVGRDMSLGDWYADVAGICTATLLLVLWKPSSSLSEQHEPPGSPSENRLL